MDKGRIARPGRESTTEARECACDDGRVYQSGVPTGRWVPCGACEGSGEQSVYVYPRRLAKTFVRVLAGGCADCGASGLDVGLHPVPNDHLTFFSGDELCEDCAGNHGVL